MPVEALKIIVARIIKECTPREVYITGKCIMLVGILIETIYSGGTPLVFAFTITILRSIIRNAKN